MTIILNILIIFTLVLAISSAVHHAEVVAHKVGEPFGTLILAICVTIIETALIISMMLSKHSDTEFILRDTIFSTIMIVLNGIIGICIFLGGIKHHELSFRIEGTNPIFAVIVCIATFSLILPTFTTSAPFGTFNDTQLIFVAIVLFALYCTAIFIQTIKHRDYFLPLNVSDQMNINIHANPPRTSKAVASFLLLMFSLILVVFLAKELRSTINLVIEYIHAPPILLGIIIAALVLMPESYAAIRASLANRLQTSLNLALGSVLASIGLSVPTVILVALTFDLPLFLGINNTNLVLFMLTIMVSTLTLATGRTTMLHGAIHIILFACYLFMSIVP